MSADREQVEPGVCTTASLEGAYGLQRMGRTSAGPVTAVGIITFDGQGNSTGSQTVSRSGLFSESQFSAPYTVNPDCTGTLTMSGPIVERLLIVHGGSEVLGMSVTPGTNVATHYEPVSDHPGAQDEAGCTNATLTGTYGFQRMGQSSQGQVTATGVVTFDGHGNSLASQTISRNGVISEAQFPGPYTVNPDCSASASMNGTAFVRYAIVHGGNEVLGMSLNPGNNVAAHFARLVDRRGRAATGDR
jgi:hypothetical protein